MHPVRLEEGKQLLYQDVRGPVPAEAEDRPVARNDTPGSSSSSHPALVFQRCPEPRDHLLPPRAPHVLHCRHTVLLRRQAAKVRLSCLAANPCAHVQQDEKERAVVHGAWERSADGLKRTHLPPGLFLGVGILSLDISDTIMVARREVPRSMP
eukprot:765591-Hanusia_phi.AAC.3